MLLALKILSPDFSIGTELEERGPSFWIRTLIILANVVIIHEAEQAYWRHSNGKRCVASIDSTYSCFVGVRQAFSNNTGSIELLPSS